ncbi:CRISPR-associated protein Csx19 [Nocardia salmonicida]|uniref:type III-D CRISPR-associated protein Csx19 n=1 Tax=Nocardia salmonicida TaxID=53431 RepID=UPI00379D55BF
MTRDSRYLVTDALGADLTFSQALHAFGTRWDVSDAVGFVYTPAVAPWFRYTDQQWCLRQGEAIPESAFELRAFTDCAELRWWCTTGFDIGTAVVLSETDQAEEGDGLYRLDDRTRALRLWGSAVTEEQGWTNLAEGRIGDVLWVPLSPVTAGSAVALRVVDYASRDEHGNVALVEQRLAGLHTLTTSTESERP